MIAEARITAELFEEHRIPVFNAKQGDTGRRIGVQLTAFGEVLTPDAADSYRFYFKKPDGTVVFQNANVSGQTFWLRLSNQTLALPGDVECEVRVGDGAEMVSTPIFTMRVFPSNFDDEAAQSTSEYSALESALATVSAYDSRISALESAAIKTTTFTGTTDANGRIEGGISTFTGTSAAKAILFAYFERESFTARRNIAIGAYGNAGYSLVFTDNGAVVASQSVTATIYYV